MAQLTLDGDELVVRLSAFEKLGAMRGDVRVPLATVSRVRVSEHPWSELRGLRAPGTGVRGILSLGTRRGSGFRDFAAVYRGRPAIVIEARGTTFDRLVISSSDAEADSRRILGALPRGHTV